MPIERGSVVRLRYDLRDGDGHALEDEGTELEYLHGGFGGIFPRVEQALEGKDVGEEVSLTLDPDDVVPRALWMHDPDIHSIFRNADLWVSLVSGMLEPIQEPALEVAIRFFT